jgi:hypothetical protein
VTDIKEVYPWGSFVIDSTTGLPVAPEGMWWRVTRRSGGYWRVKLMTGHQFFRRTVKSSISGPGTPITRSNILEGAGYCLYQFQKSGDERSLIGNYPPKKLEN